MKQYFEGRASSMAVSPLCVTLVLTKRVTRWLCSCATTDNGAGISVLSNDHFFVIFYSNKKIVLSHTYFTFAPLIKKLSLCFIISVQCWYVFNVKSFHLRTLKVCIVYRNVINKIDDAYLHSILPLLHINTRKFDLWFLPSGPI